VSETDFNSVRDEQLAEIERRRTLYLGDRPHPKLSGRTVIVVDDGIATGATTRAALRAISMRKPAKLVLAVPVAPTHTLETLRGEVDDLVCLEDYVEFGAIGLFYSDFRQVSDTDVIALLAAHPVKSPAAAG
jgi:predicted phosphoribosyltransferase